MHIRSLALFVIVCLVFAAGCRRVEFQPRLTAQSELHVDQLVRTSGLSCSIRPRGTASERLSVLIIPFRLEQNVVENRDLARQLTRAFWAQWTGREVFDTILLDEDAFFYDLEHATELGRQRGVDLVVTGVIPYVLPGGGQGDTALNLRLEIVDTRTGGLVWGLEQTARMQADFREDYIFLARTTRLPMSPLHAVVARLAKDMAEPLLIWTEQLPASGYPSMVSRKVRTR